MKTGTMGKFLPPLAALFLPVAAIAAPDSLPAIKSTSEFDMLARKVTLGRQSPYPQVMFLVDRQEAVASGKPRLYFINSRSFQSHIEFILQRGLSRQSMNQLIDVSYTLPNRRFIMGSLVRYPSLARYGVEFWQGDKLDVPLLTLTLDRIASAFPEPVAFTPNSETQLALARALPQIPVIDGNSIYGAADSLVLNGGSATGRLRLVKRVQVDMLLGKGDIVILEEMPVWLSPVAGIITAEFSTPLAHVNLLAKSWKVPNAYVRDAAAKYRALDGQMVRMETLGETVVLRAATASEIAKAEVVRRKQAVRTPAADLTFAGLPALVEQRRTDGVRIGAKAANLGEVAQLAIKASPADFTVPAGFSIPFVYYDRFVRENAIDRDIDRLLSRPAVERDQRATRDNLARLRERIEKAPFSPDLLMQIVDRRNAIMGDVGVFVRSSTNSEDLKGFNGAGLYTSVPNVKGDAALADAIKTVWASVWNNRAFEARDAAGIDHRSVKAAVLVQQGVNAQASGVMITQNPFNPDEPGAVFINAKRGLGMRVVEGRRVAEQLIYRADPESVQLLTRSSDDAMLSFDEKGGVRELPVEPGHIVLTDELARRLARVGLAIQKRFGGRPQDIEWLVEDGSVYIVQSRPYLPGN